MLPPYHLGYSENIYSYNVHKKHSKYLLNLKNINEWIQITLNPTYVRQTVVTRALER
jgi:hypothetical protein